jgi:hypothetical protein
MIPFLLLLYAIIKVTIEFYCNHNNETNNDDHAQAAADDDDVNFIIKSNTCGIKYLLIV